ncbi:MULTISPECIES: sensor histidine kinase [Pseudoalteromonas]|uniref:sensor histidine kinase n=3 Tax=Pseudoalteromonas TaxID=53246 RepID=UPI001EFFDA56|nr:MULTISPECIES: sensor histidine kinase [Pseudoalteromonas]
MTMLRLFSLLLILAAMAVSAADFTSNAKYRVSTPLTIYFDKVDKAQLSSILVLGPDEAEAVLDKLNQQRPEHENKRYQWAVITPDMLLPMERNYIAFGFGRLPWLNIALIKDNEVSFLTQHTLNTTFAEREVQAPQLYVPVSKEDLAGASLIVRYQTFANAPADLRLINDNELNSNVLTSTLMNAALSGIIAAVFIIVLVNFYFNANTTNAYYCIWTLLFLLIVLDMSGFTFQYFWPLHGKFATLFSACLMTFVPVFHLLFIRQFLQLKRRNETLHFLYNGFLTAYLLLIPIAIYSKSVHYNLVLSLSIIPLFLYTSYWSLKQRAPGSVTFSLSLLNHVIFVNFIAIGGTMYTGFINVLHISSAIKFGYLIEVMLFTLALAQQNKSAQNNLLSTLQTQVNALANTVQSEKQFNHENQQALEKKEQRLFTDLSHELRTPLTVMKVQVESLQYNIVENVQESYSKLMDKIDELNHFINQLMLVTDHEKLATMLNLRDFTICKLVNQVHTQAATLFKDNKERLEVNYQISGTEKITIDLDAITNCILEILGNAIKHGGDKVQVKMSFFSVDSNLIIRIEDSGTPLSYEAHQQLFDPLYKSQSARTNSGKSKGMGLAMCKKVVEAHSGQIESFNSLLGGLNMEIKLPLTKTPAFS